jgi:uncharacterized protein (UPF0335 family)
MTENIKMFFDGTFSEEEKESITNSFQAIADDLTSKGLNSEGIAMVLNIAKSETGARNTTEILTVEEPSE